MMPINIVYVFVWSLFFFGTETMGPGYSMRCCDIALQTLAYLNKSIPHDDYKCGQVYEATIPPAPPLLVSTSWCRKKCSGYALSAPSDTNAWAAPLIQYILPAVIFSMTIPRRLVLSPPRWFFDFNINHMSGLIKALFSLCVAGVIVTLDTAVWVFIIMVAPAPFIFSGLLEVVLDYRIIRNLMSSHTDQGKDQPVGLDRAQRVQLLTAVLAGNLGIEGIPADPQGELGTVLDINKHPEEVKLHLGAMLACQYPFGAAVGAPILLYIGSFVYTLATIRNSDGDRETARALAFGIWWMNIVHVSAISGCLLASNNPTTAGAIVKLRRVKVGLQARLGYADKRSEMEDKIQARLEAWSRLPLSYKARYEPVWMWTRGKSKAGWLRRTSAWEQHWFREKVEMTVPGWMFLAFVAFSLVLFPCALAFWIEYSTPARGVGCRSLTILGMYVTEKTLYFPFLQRFIWLKRCFEGAEVFRFTPKAVPPRRFRHKKSVLTLNQFQSLRLHSIDFHHPLSLEPFQSLPQSRLLESPPLAGSLAAQMGRRLCRGHLPHSCLGGRSVYNVCRYPHAGYRHLPELPVRFQWILVLRFYRYG